MLKTLFIENSNGKLFIKIVPIGVTFTWKYRKLY